MNSRKSIVTFINQLVILAIGILTTKLILTVLPPSDYGLFGYAFSLSGLFLVFSDLNLNSVYMKRLAEGGEAQKYYSNYVFLKSIMIGVSIVIFIGYSVIAHLIFKTLDFTTICIIAILFLSYISDVFFHGLLILYQSKREVKVSQTVLLLVALMNFIYICLFVFVTKNIYLFSFSLFVKSITGVGLLFWSLRRQIEPFNFRFDSVILRNYWTFMLPLVPMVVFGVFYDKLDAVLVNTFLSLKETGYFVAAQRLNLFILLASSAIMTILYASFSEFAALKDFAMIEQISNKATKYISLLITMISVFILFNAKAFVGIFMSHEYLPTVPIIQVFMVQVILMSVSRTFDSIILAVEKLKFASLFGIALYIIGIGLNFILIPKELFGVPLFGLGAAGPAIKSLIIYSISISVTAIFLYSRFKIRLYWRFVFHLVAALLSGWLVELVVFLCCWIGPLYLLIKTFMFLFGYLSILWLIKEITIDDVKYFKNIVYIKKRTT